MARTIDEKVVEMRFDNRDFESNVSQSMSTLDKLKSALNFSGVENAFSGISSAADKVNLHGMADALDGLGNKFSALETIAVGALMNIGATISSAVIDKLKEVSIDQVTEGFNKYGEKTTAVQTIMNATGRSIDDVSEKLKTLNWFTDETSYNFTDMTNNIGKFTSQGVELEEAVAAMQGISTAAALAGQNAQSASRVMYNFSQSLGMGAVRLQDWMSVENANMATEEFKQTIIDTAVELGKLDKYGNILQNTSSNYSGDNFVNVGNFRSTLAAGWFDSDVLIKAMNKFGGFAGRLNDVYNVFNENYDVTTSQILKWINQYMDGTLSIEEVVKRTGLAAEEILPYLEELGSEEYELGRRAFAAAQEAKTFEDVVNATKDAVSTGWMNVFEQIFGNYEEAKVMWTELANELWDIFAGPISSLNDLLIDWNNLETPDGLNGRGLLIQSFKDLYHAARNIIDPITEAWEAIFPPMDGQQLFDLTARFQAFTESLQISEDTMVRIGEAFEKIFGAIKYVSDGIKTLLSAFTGGLFDQIGGGFSKGFLSILENVADAIDGFIQKVKGISLVYDIFNETGRTAKKLEKLKETYPIIYGLVDIFNKLKNSLEYIGEYIGNLLSLNNYLVYFGEAGGGIAGIINIITFSIRDFLSLINQLSNEWFGLDLTEPFAKAWGVLLKFERTIEDLQANGVFDRLGEKFFGLFDTFKERFGSIVDWLKPLGDAMSSIWNDMADGIGMLIGKEGEGVEGFFASIEKGLDAVNDFIANSPTLGKVVDGFKGIISDISEFLTKFLSFSDTIQTFRDAGGGLSGVAAVITQKLRDILDLIADVIQRVTGLDLHDVGSAIATAFGIGLKVINKVISAVKNFFKLFKSDETKDLDEFGDKVEKKFSPIKSLFEGLKKFFEGIWSVLKQLSPVFATIGEKVGEAFGNIGDSLKNLDLNKIFEFFNKGLGLAFGAGIVRFVHSLSEPLEGLKGLFGPVKDVLDGVKGCFEAWQKDLQAKTLLKLAAAIGIVTIAVIALSQVDSGKLGSSIAAITLLFTDLIGAMTANNKLNGSANGKNMGKIGVVMIEMAASVLIMSSALKKIADLDWEEILKGVTGLGIVLGEMIIAINLMPKNRVKGGLVMIEMAAALLIAANALKEIGELSWGEILKGLVGMGIALAEMTAALAILGNFGGSTFGKGLELVLVAASLKIIASALEDFGSMQWDEIARGLVAMGGALVEVAATLVILGNFGQKMLTTSVSLVIVGAALNIIADALTSFSALSWEEMARGLVAMGGALLEVVGVLVILSMFSNGALVNSAALVLVGAALNIISDALKSFAGLEWEEIARGLLAMGGALAEIVVTLMLLSASGGIAGAAALIVVAAALAMLAPVLHSFGDMSLAEIGKSLLELAGVFLIIGAAGLLLGPISPLILALGAAIALLGAGCIGVGAGLLMFSAGLTALAAAGTGAIDLLIYAIKQILELIPLLITKVGEGILAIIKMIGEHAPAIAESVVKVVAAILDAARVLIPKLVETVITIIDSILATLAEHSGSIIDSVATIILNLLNGIAEYLPDFIQAGVNIVLSLIEGLGQGIIDNAERAREAFTNLFKSIVEAILIFLGVDKDEAEEFVNIAADMINGLTSGIAKFAMNAITAVGEFMTNLVNKAKEKLPEFIERGKEIIDNIKEGFNSKVEDAIESLKSVIGKIIDGAKGVVDKAKDLGKKIIDKIKGGTEEPESKETAQNVGKSVGDNVAKGLEKSSDTTIKKAAKKVINQAVDSMKKAASISSPSEVTREEVGQFLGAGIASGLFDSIPNCEEKAKDLLSRVTGTMKEDEFLKEAKDAGFDVGEGFFDGLFQNEVDISNLGTDFVATFSESAVSNDYEAYTAGVDVGDSLCDGLLSQYSDMLSAGEYDASGALAGISSYAEGGDNAWYTQDVTTDFVTTIADGMVSNVDLAEDAGRSLAEATQDGFLGAGWNEFQQKAFEPFKDAFEGISGYASDPWFVMNNDQLDEYTSSLKKRLDEISDTTSSVSRVVQYGDTQFQRDELEAYMTALENSGAIDASRSFRNTMNGFYGASEANLISGEFEYAHNSGFTPDFDENTDMKAFAEEMAGVRADLAKYHQDMENMQIVMDSGLIVGATSVKMDNALGKATVMGRRGV